MLIMVKPLRLVRMILNSWRLWWFTVVVCLFFVIVSSYQVMQSTCTDIDDYNRNYGDR